MRPILLLILTISVTLLGTSTWAETPKEKWEGYKPVSEAGLPPQVKEFAENSVFYMQTVDSLNGEDMEIIDLETDPQAKVKITDKKTLTDDLALFQIETCRKQKLRYCPIAKAVTNGSMFYNNNKFYTCRHSFHNWITVAAEANNRSVGEVSPPMILRLPKKSEPGKFKVVYQSAFENNPMMKFSFINEDPNLNVKINENDLAAATNNSSIRQADFVEMTISSEKSKFIVDSKLPVENLNASSKNVEVYGLGYPHKTQYSSLAERNAAGKELAVTHGFSLGFYDDKNVFYSSNFASPGMSGSPVVSKDGKLIGLSCSAFDMEKSNTQASQVNLGFFPLNKSQVGAFWRSIDLAQGSTSQETITVAN